MGRYWTDNGQLRNNKWTVRGKLEIIIYNNDEPDSPDGHKKDGDVYNVGDWLRSPE